ncbi:MAG: hypothetical protein AAFX99_17500 [Myxococcota bacterium]
MGGIEERIKPPKVNGVNPTRRRVVEVGNWWYAAPTGVEPRPAQQGAMSTTTTTASTTPPPSEHRYPHRAAGARSPWIVSPRFDLAIVLVPMMVALGTLFLIRGLSIREPLWAYLVFFVAFDVAHVWGTIYITYLDQEVMERRRRLLVGVVPVCFVAACGAHLISPTLFWTVLAYVAIVHFIKQQYGFIAIYRAKGRERSPWDRRLDSWALWVGALGPVVLWHATPQAQFDWFGSGEQFALTLPPSVQPVVWAVWGATAVVWVGRQLHMAMTEGRFNVGKAVWMVASWVSWYVGIRLADHLFISAAFINLMHGVPYLGLIWFRCNVRWQGEDGHRLGGLSPLVAWLSQRRHWVAFYLVVFTLALLEEALWDGLVWGKYLPALLGVDAPTLSAVALSLLVALLSLPQIVHYALDSFLWKMDGTNPDLERALKGS